MKGDEKEKKQFLRSRCNLDLNKKYFKLPPQPEK